MIAGSPEGPAHSGRHPFRFRVTQTNIHIRLIEIVVQGGILAGCTWDPTKAQVVSAFWVLLSTPPGDERQA